MQAMVLTWEQVALLALAYVLVGVVGVFVGGLLMQRPKRKADDLTGLRHDVESLRQELTSLREQNPPVAPAKPEESAYSQAIRLARQGLDSASVAAGCGISRGEAELIVALYRASQRP